jgi:hypothetical protein
VIIVKRGSSVSPRSSHSPRTAGAAGFFRLMVTAENPPRSSWGGFDHDKPRLLGSPISRIDLAVTTYYRRICQLQLIRS